MRNSRFLQRLCTFLVAASMLYAGPSPAAPACADLEDAGTAYAVQWLACSDDPEESSAVGVSPADVDKLLGDAVLPIPRVFRTSYTLPVADQRVICPVEWLKPAARGPPRTIRFCSFLI